MEFLENDKGVHLVGVGQGGEFTLCGDSFDVFETEEDFEDGALVKTIKTKVTCPDCLREIRNCRGAKI
tara:strand:- start:593 stop:796 length:204 start_codon:yes stop_codon:yes gene_type:complete